MNKVTEARSYSHCLRSEFYIAVVSRMCLPSLLSQSISDIRRISERPGWVLTPDSFPLQSSKDIPSPNRVPSVRGQVPRHDTKSHRRTARRQTDYTYMNYWRHLSSTGVRLTLFASQFLSLLRNSRCFCFRRVNYTRSRRSFHSTPMMVV